MTIGSVRAVNHGKPMRAAADEAAIQTRNRERGPGNLISYLTARSGFPCCFTWWRPWCCWFLAAELYPIWLLLSLVVFDCVRSQRIHARRGINCSRFRLRWQNAEWGILRTPWVINSGMLRCACRYPARTASLAGGGQRGRRRWRSAPAGATKTALARWPSGKCSAISPRICSHPALDALVAQVMLVGFIQRQANRRWYRRSPVSGW